MSTTHGDVLTHIRPVLARCAGQPVVPLTTAADFRLTIPAGDRSFWRTYAHGTFQNFPTVGLHFNYRQPGNYRFDLTPRPLDTSHLAAGRYRITVDAADLCGNQTSATELVGIGLGR